MRKDTTFVQCRRCKAMTDITMERDGIKTCISRLCGFCDAEQIAKLEDRESVVRGRYRELLGRECECYSLEQSELPF